MNARAIVSWFLVIISVICLAGLDLEAAAAAVRSGDGKSKDDNKGAQAKDPINANSGAFHFELPLFQLGGPLALNYGLRYGMHQDPSAEHLSHFQGSASLLLERVPHENGTDVVAEVHLRNGETLSFTRDPGAGEWALDAAARVRYVLKETGPDDAHGWFYLMDPVQEQVVIFEKVTAYCYPDSCPARPAYILDRHGNRLEYGYTLNRLTPDLISDNLGRSLAFTYFPYSDTVSRITDHGGRFTEFLPDWAAADFNGGPVLRSVVDPAGNTTTFRYGYLDSHPRYASIVSVEMPRGNIPFTQTVAAVTLDEETLPRVTSQTDAYGNATLFAYEGTVNRVTESRPDGRFVVYEHYHNNGVPSNITDAAGKSISCGQTENEQVSRITDRLGDEILMDYHPQTGKLASYRDAEGHETTFEYSAQSQTFTNPATRESVAFTFYGLIGTHYPDGTSEAYAYDAQGNRLSCTDREGGLWTWTYNQRGQVLTETNPLGGVVTVSYNPDGTTASRHDPETGTTTFGHDAFKRLNQITFPDGAGRHLCYDAMDRTTAVTDERGGAFTYAYDANGNLVLMTDPAGHSVSYAYDLLDRLVIFTDRRGKATDYTFDSMGNRSAANAPDSVATTYGYDPRGWRNSETVGGAAWLIDYDDEGVPSATTTPLGFTTRRQTNRLGSIVGETDPMGNLTVFTRDGMDRVTRMTDPLGRSTDYAYNGLDRLVSVSPPGAGTAYYQRNPLGLLAQITDLAGQAWQFGYSALGRKISETDPAGSVWTFQYNERGLLNRIAYPDGEIQSLAYDAAGNLIRRSFSSGLVLEDVFDPLLNRQTGADGVSLAFDASGHVASTTQHGSSTCTAAYDDGGRLISSSFNEGALVVTYGYDPLTGLLQSVTDSLTGTRIEFAYDADRRVTSMDRPNGVRTEFSWDGAARLTRIRHGGLADLRLTLDAAGQITAMDLSAPLDPGTLPAENHGATGLLAGARNGTDGYAQDLRGRRLSDPARSYAWDAASRLVKAGDATLAYNGLDDLSQRVEGGETTRFYTHHAMELPPVVAERSSSGAWLRFYVTTPSGRLLYLIEPSAGNRVRHFHFDQAGNTLFLTDASGTVTDAYAYEPYGLLLGHAGESSQPFTFGGEWGVRQEGAGGDFYQMRARYYDALTGRFLSRDPSWPALEDPMSLNPYQFAYQSPLSYIDPEGRFGIGTAVKIAWKTASYVAKKIAGTEVEDRTGVNLPPTDGVEMLFYTTDANVGAEISPKKKKSEKEKQREYEEQVHRGIAKNMAQDAQEHERKTSKREASKKSDKNGAKNAEKETKGKKGPTGKPVGGTVITTSSGVKYTRMEDGSIAVHVPVDPNKVQEAEAKGKGYTAGYELPGEEGSGRRYRAHYVNTQSSGK